jgi:hypothetical protein
VPTYTVTDDLLNSEAAANYFTRADRRIMIGLRLTLEHLEMPVPEWAKRQPPGPRAGKGLVAALAADHPSERRNITSYTRRPNASPDAVAAAKRRNATRLGL